MKLKLGQQFSLLEVVISTAILMMILGVTLNILNSSHNLFITSSTKKLTESKASQILNKIVCELEDATLSTVCLKDSTNSSGILFQKKISYNTATKTFSLTPPISWEFRLTQREGGNEIDDNGINGIDDPTEGDNIDNNDNGFIDEGNIVRIVYTSPNDFNPTETTLFTSQALKIDDNSDYGTGLYGLSFSLHPTIPNIIKVFVAIQSSDANGKKIIARAEAEVVISN